MILAMKVISVSVAVLVCERSYSTCNEGLILRRLWRTGYDRDTEHSQVTCSMVLN